MTYTRYPSAAGLSEHYRQLEGFTDPALACQTDFSKADLKILTANSLTAVEKRFSDSLSDVLMTLSVVFSLLIASSVVLGLAASQLTFAVRQLTYQSIEARLEDASPPKTP